MIIIYFVHSYIIKLWYLEKIFKFSFDKKIKKIIKIYNPFINFKFNKLTQHDYLQKIVKLYIDDTKQMEKLCEMNNSNIKKIMNIILNLFTNYLIDCLLMRLLK